MLSAESSISNINAKSISLDETEFENNMESARARLSRLSADMDTLSNQSDQTEGNSFKTQLGKYKPHEPSMAKALSLSDIENREATMIMKEDMESRVFRAYPCLFARVGDLTISDVENLLHNHKKLVFKHVCLSKGLGVPTTTLKLSNSQIHPHGDVETAGRSDESQEHTAMTNSSSTASLVNEENLESKYLQEVAKALQAAIQETGKGVSTI